MAWKVLIFLAIIAVGVSAGRYELKQHKKTQLRETVETLCEDKDYVNGSQRIQLTGMAVGAAECLFKNVDMMYGHLPSPENTTLQDSVLDLVSRFCTARLELRKCAQQLLESIAPCTSAPVQAQVGDMKIAITELFNQFCDEDMAKTHRSTTRQ